MTYLMLRRTRQAQITIVAPTIVVTINMGFLMIEGPSARARAMCAATKRAKSAPVVVTYAFMTSLLENLRPVFPYTSGDAGGDDGYSADRHA